MRARQIFHQNLTSMIAPNLDNIALPLEDPGKPDAGKSADRKTVGRSRLHMLIWVAPALGLGVLIVVCLLPFVSTEWTASLKTLLKDAPEQEENHPAPPVAGDVVALGRLVPKGGTVALAFPSGAGDARISRLIVSEGEEVETDQVVAELDNLTALQAAKSLAEANVAIQEATLQQVRDSALLSLAEGRANHATAQVTLTLAQQNLDRQTKLAATNATTQVLLEQAQANAAKAHAELQRTAALIHRFIGVEMGRQSDIELAARNLDRARADLARAAADCAAARVVAPRAGTVLKIHSRVGEKPADTGVVTIGDVSQMTVELEVYQADVAHVALGQDVSVKARPLSVPLTGKVTDIGRMVGRQSMMSTEPAANADARVVLVTVSLDAQSSAASRAYTHLEVVGTIRTTAR